MRLTTPAYTNASPALLKAKPAYTLFLSALTAVNLTRLIATNVISYKLGYLGLPLLARMLKVLQINVNRDSPTTESALDLAIKVDAKIVAVQEPWLPKGSSYANTRSTAHQDFTQISPTLEDSSLRPRVLFYIRKDLEVEVNPFISDDNDFLAIKVIASTSASISIIFITRKAF